ncbi:hypothetical protein Acj61p005 [Acinetobacter phage Acj61]|uniref:Uncharacterized protein n=1 Tax=Acinetobacter phage Acj61 TaxID=760732 RepID=E5E3Y6_9CAUD|nr:hypothetical protein Acj61p005 [Acinetobacter phage Acj61]ADG35970.1 hypothetical protein Acj61p005 [Acinetobacter phage Acj61]
MYNLNNGQMILCFIIGLIIAVALFVTQTVNAAPATDPKLWVAECTDQKGRINVYRGSSSSFDFSYDSGILVITTATHKIRYPIHMCTISIPR